MNSLQKTIFREGVYVSFLVLTGFDLGVVGGYSFGVGRGRVAENRRCVETLQDQREVFLDTARYKNLPQERITELRCIASNLDSAAKSISIYGVTEDAED